MKLSIILMLLWSLTAYSDVTNIIVWEPYDDGPKLILPIVNHENPEAIARKLVDKLLSEPTYDNVLEGKAVDYEFDRFRELTPSDMSPKFVVAANRLGHMLKKDKFPFVRQALERHGGTPHILPLGLDLILNEDEQIQFHTLLREKYEALVLIGGGDIHPSFYSTMPADQGPEGVNARRDGQEMRLLKEWMTKGAGKIFGICRGHQMIGVSQQMDMVQHIEDDFPDIEEEHAVPDASGSEQATSAISSHHPIDLVDEDNVFYEMFGTKRIRVNSRHHQAIRYRPCADLKVIAEVEGVVEAMEFCDKRGFTTQFHPEDMEDEIGESIMKQMVDQSRKTNL